LACYVWLQVCYCEELSSTLGPIASIVLASPQGKQTFNEITFSKETQSSEVIIPIRYDHWLINIVEKLVETWKQGTINQSY